MSQVTVGQSSVKTLYSRLIGNGDTENTLREVGGYICNNPNCNDKTPVSPAETAVTVALYLLISAFTLVTLVVVILIFHFLMWKLEKWNKVDTSQEIPCR